jgi:hypothetical protein
MLGFGPISSLPISALPELVVSLFASGALTAADSLDFRIYAATREYISLPADTPANQPFEGTLDTLPRVDRSMINGSRFGGLAVTWGSMKLNNRDGFYDYLVRSYAVDGQVLTFKVGDPSGTYAAFFTMASLLGKAMHVADDVIEIELSDNSFRLEVPAQAISYAGTGDMEGTADLAGKRKPRAFGLVKNLTPPAVIPGELVYQVNAGPVQAISAVYDQGYPLGGPTADFATSALLRAATVTDGYFATCLAEGVFKLGAPASQVTADVQGDSGGGYVNTRGTIIRRLLAATDVADPGELDVVSFGNFEIDQPGQIGFYLSPDATDTVAQAIDKLIAPVMGWAGFDIRNARFQIGLLKAPAGTPIGVYDDVDILDVQPEKLPSAFDPPPYRQRVSYDHNWTQITNPVAGLAETNPDRVAWLATPYKVASTPDSLAAPVKQKHKNAQDPDVIVSYFVNLADAAAEAARQHALANSGYTLDRVVQDLSANVFTLDIGQTMLITYPRRGFAAGKLGRLVAVSDDPDSNTVEGWIFG